MNIQGKTAIVTGGASGLGAATARMIQDAGGRVVILDLNDAGQLSDQARFAKTDVSDATQVEAAIQLAVEAFGGIHFAVNCAGIGDPQKILGKDGPASLERFARVIKVNLIGTFNVARLAAAAMARNEPEANGEPR